jgi:16S rRNA (uracil1498-N3)-methyltransferase
MRIPRIFTPQVLTEGTQAALAEEAAHHIAKVLRMPAGAALILFNGDGSEYKASIALIDKRQVLVAVEQKTDAARESPLTIQLGIAISKGDRMDWVIQKATELGVTAIAPLSSERVEVRLQGERAEKKLQHWRGVATAACEQCARNRLPRLEPIQSLHDWLRGVEAEHKYVLHHRSAQPLSRTAARPRSVALLIGPEGGLSDVEIGAAQQHGFAPLLLGPRVLRTETAPLAALSVMQFLWGDLGD